MHERLGYHSCGFNGCVLASMHAGNCLFAEDPGRQRTRRPSFLALPLTLTPPRTRTRTRTRTLTLTLT
mgnify:CR=1 FL=1